MINPSTTIRIKELARLWEKYGNLVSASNVQNSQGKAKAAYKRASEYISQIIDEEEELLLKKGKK